MGRKEKKKERKKEKKYIFYFVKTEQTHYLSPHPLLCYFSPIL